MAKTLDTLRKHRIALLEIAHRHGVQTIRVFGSAARGDDRPDSDVDLLIAMEKGRDILDLVGFKLDAEALLARRVDLVSEGYIHHLLASSILSEAQPL